MPHLSPMNWLSALFFLSSILLMLSSSFWWFQPSSFKSPISKLMKQSHKWSWL